MKVLFSITVQKSDGWVTRNVLATGTDRAGVGTPRSRRLMRTRGRSVCQNLQTLRRVFDKALTESGARPTPSSDDRHTPAFAIFE